jgi:HK97 family phage major capsid protein
MSAKIRELQAQRAKKLDAMKSLHEIAEAADRDFTADEQTQFAALKAEAETLGARIERAQEVEKNALAVAGQSYGSTKAEEPEIAKDPKRGFSALGEFAILVRSASLAGHTTDERLLIGAAAPTTFGNEATGSDGGYLVPPEFAKEIFTLSLGEDSLLPLTDSIDISGNSLVFPKDETTPWGTSSVRAYWQAEGTAGTGTKPALGGAVLRLHKLMALVALTDELLADTNALSSYLPEKIGQSLRWKVNEAILSGTGAGQPLGAFVGGAAVVQAKDSGQAANTISLANITGMIARLIPGSFAKAVWIITPDALPSIFGLTLSNYPIYLPISAGAQGSPYGTLMGRPLLVSQHAAAFSSQGDLALMDLSFYRTIKKSGGPQQDVSMHLYFDADAIAYRTTYRIDGQPKIAAPVSQAKGSNTLSPFIQLAAR